MGQRVAKGSEARRRRQAEAAERQDRWDKMNRSEKLLSLIERGHGHCQQARLLKHRASSDGGYWTKDPRDL